MLLPAHPSTWKASEQRSLSRRNDYCPWCLFPKPPKQQWVSRGPEILENSWEPPPGHSTGISTKAQTCPGVLRTLRAQMCPPSPGWPDASLIIRHRPSPLTSRPQHHHTGGRLLSYGAQNQLVSKWENSSTKNNFPYTAVCRARPTTCISVILFTPFAYIIVMQYLSDLVQ